MFDKPYDSALRFKHPNKGVYDFKTDEGHHYVVSGKIIDGILWYSFDMSEPSADGSEPNSIRVWATIVHILRALVAQYPVEYIAWKNVPTNQNIKSLYERLVKNLPDLVPGFEYHSITPKGETDIYMGRRTPAAP